MKRTTKHTPMIAAAALLALACAERASAGSKDEVDPATLYQLSTEGSAGKLSAGRDGSFVLRITTVEGAYISDEAPLRIDLEGKKVKPAKTRLTYQDSVTRVEGQKPPPDPRFEVPLTAEGKGQGAVDAKVTLFICTETLCVRQVRSVSVPVEVE